VFVYNTKVFKTMFLGADANIPGYVFFTQYHRGKHGPKTNVRDSASLRSFGA